MPQTCSVCRHPSREAIDRALLANEPYRTISGQHRVSKTALLRHRASCLPTDLVRAHDAAEVTRADGLLGDVRAAEGRAERLYAAAEEILRRAMDGENKDHRTALQAIRAAVDVMGEARSYLELRGELTHELGRGQPDTTMRAIVVMPAEPGTEPAKVALEMDVRRGQVIDI